MQDDSSTAISSPKLSKQEKGHSAISKSGVGGKENNEFLLFTSKWEHNNDCEARTKMEPGNCFPAPDYLLSQF